MAQQTKNKKKINTTQTQHFNTNQKKNITGYEPSYLKDKLKWKKLEDTHNCYAFALDIKDQDVNFPQPGLFGIKNFDKYISDNKEFTCNTYHTRILMDNPHIYPIQHKKKCKKGYYKVFFTISPNEDYHWYRQDDNGLFTHKPGSTPVKTTDSSNKIIYDPQYANRFTSSKERLNSNELYYVTLCNSYCIPKTYLFVE